MNGNTNEGRPDKGRAASARKRLVTNIPATPPPGGTGPSLQAILDAMPDILFVVDREGRIYNYYAPNSSRLYVPPDQFLGRRMKEVLPEPAAGIVDRAIQLAVEKGHHHGSVYSLPSPAGEQWYELSLSAQGDMQTPDGRLIAIVRDITARKLAEQDLRDSREYLAMVINSIHEALIVHDAQTGAVLDVNQRLCEISGYTREEVLAHGMGPLCAGTPPYTLDELVAWNHKACTEGPQHVEFLTRHHDGHLVWVEVHLRRVQMGPNDLLLASVQDITQRKTAESALRDSEEKYRALTESMKDVVWVLDVEAQRFLYVSPSVTQLRGYTPEEILARPLEEAWAPAERPRLAAFTAEAARAFRAGEISTNTFVTYEMLQPCKDGSRVPSEVIAHLVLNPHTGRLEAHGVTRDIRDRKRMEEQLRVSEERFAQLARQSRTIIWEVDANGLYTYINPVVEEVLGYRPDELIGIRHFYDWYPEESRAAVKAAAFEIFRQKTELTLFENQIRSKDGRLRWLITNGFPLLNEAGQLRGYRGSGTDITERKEAEAALRESEARFAAATQASRSYVWQVDPEGLITYISPMVTDVLGRRPEDLVGRMYFFDLLPEEDREEVKKFGLAMMARREAIRGFENRNVAQDGRLVWLSSSASPLFAPDGTFCGYQGIDTDITARKETEAALKESEARFAASTKASRSYVWQVDPDGVYTFISPVVEDVLGYRPNEIIGKLHFYNILPEEDREETKRFGLALMARHESINGFENRNVAKDGRTVWVVSSASPIFAPDGTYQGYQGIDIDITARKEAEDALRESEARLRTMQDNLPQGLVYQVDTGTDGTRRQMIYISRGVEQLHGVTAAEALQNAGVIYDQMLPEDRQQLIETEGRAIAALASFRAEVRLRMPSGEIRWRLFTSAPRRWPNGHLVWDGVELDITDRKQAEEALRESETRFRELYERMRDSVAVVDMTGHIRGCNPAFAALLGYREEELQGKHFQEITPPGWEAVDAEGARQVLKMGFGGPMEKAYAHKNGTIIPVEIVGSLMRNAHGQPTGVLVVVRDITARKEAETALKLSEANYRQLYKAMRDPFARADLHGRLLEINPAFEELLGYPAAELIGQSFRSITPRKWHAGEKKIIRDQVRKRGFSAVYEKEYRRKDGTRVPVELRTMLVCDASGRPVGMSAVVRDISERKRTELALQQAHDELEQRVVERTAELESSRAALAQSEEQFRQMAESIEDMFWLYEVQTRRMLYVSPVFEAIWGRPLRKMKITPRTWLATIHPDDRQRVRDFFTEREGIRVFPQMEYRVLRPDGSFRWVSSRSWEIRNAKGKVYRIAGVVRDITSQRRMEAEILNAAEAERLRIGRDLHDSLGQALTGIGYLTAAVHADLARKAQPEAAEVEKLARLVGKTAEQAHDLSRGLLLTDLKRGGLVTALQELAHHTQALYPLVCRYTGPAENPLIDANAASNLYRIAQEAITNAVKHSRAKTITIHLDHSAEGLLLAVKDTGRGLTGKKSHTGGLGLDIMRYRAGLMGATLWIDSARNGGTTVNCLLPVPATKRK